MKATSAERVESVLTLLHEQGWQDDGGVSNPDRATSQIPGGRWIGVAGYVRYRLRLGERRCTVGPRKTSFYRVVNKQAMFEGPPLRTDPETVRMHLEAPV